MKTSYLLDANRYYAQVLEEYDNSGTKVTYVHGIDLISQNRSGAKSFYLVDRLGSARALTDASGVVTDRYIYDAYGNVLSSIGTTQNSYLYTGEQFDAGAGQYYLRDRYYNQAVGRFTRSDSWNGDTNNPLSLNKYLYANGNAVNAIDPSGFRTQLGGFVDFALGLGLLNFNPVTAVALFGGEAHRAVEADIVDRHPFERFIPEFPVNGGRVDLFQEPNFIYEIKPWTNEYEAYPQLARYFEDNPGYVLGRNILQGSVKNPPLLYGITIDYETTIPGIILYHPYINSDGYGVIVGVSFSIIAITQQQVIAEVVSSLLARLASPSAALAGI